jgi:hypothetical protein
VDWQGGTRRQPSSLLFVLKEAHLLVTSDLSEGDCSRAVSVGLLYTTGSWGRLACG